MAERRVPLGRTPAGPHQKHAFQTNEQVKLPTYIYFAGADGGAAGAAGGARLRGAHFGVRIPQGPAAGALPALRHGRFAFLKPQIGGWRWAAERGFAEAEQPFVELRLLAAACWRPQIVYCS